MAEHIPDDAALSRAVKRHNQPRWQTSIPLFHEGEPTWLPGQCPRPECGALVESMTPAEGAAGDVVDCVLRPCGHTASYSSVVDVRLT